MTRPRRFAAAMLFTSLLFPAARASAEPIRAGDVLRITFDLNAGPPVQYDFGNLEYFEFAIFLSATAPIDAFTARLFDGPQLLGTYTAPFETAVVARFISPTSTYTGPAAVIDFTAFNNATIAGVLEFTIGTGAGTLHRTSDELSVGGDVGPFISTSAIYPTSFTVVAAEAPVPEPATMLLMGSGLVFAALGRRRRHQSNQGPGGA